MNTKSRKLNIRVNPEIKAQADPILQKMGLTATQLYNLLLSQVAIQKRVPFSIVAENESMYTWMPSIAEIEELHDSVANGTAKRYKTAEALFADLDAEDDDE